VLGFVFAFTNPCALSVLVDIHMIGLMQICLMSHDLKIG
jgi:hypothetical protein